MLDLSQVKQGDSLKTSLVDIDSIEAVDFVIIPDYEIDDNKALAVYKIGGFVKPPVVRRLIQGGRERYQLLRGIEQLSTALYLYSIDDDFEMVRCYVVTNDEEQDLAIFLYDQ